MYLDYVDQAIASYSDAPEPSGYIIHNPREFNKWVEWAKNYKPIGDSGFMGFESKALGLKWHARTFEEFLEVV